MATTLKQAKAALREKMKKILAELSIEDKKQQSEIVFKKVLASSVFKESQRLSLFLSMPDEIDTTPLLQAAVEMGKECFIPQYQGQHMKMVPLASLADYHSLPVTKWNIKQPADNDVRPDALTTGGLDLIFMPGLAFTKQGIRLGRGKGYYDNYLLKCRNAGIMPCTVALIFKEQLVNHVPTSEHDMPVDFVICAATQDF